MEAYVIYNKPDQDLNLLYWGHFLTPDPFFALKVGSRSFAFVSELEYGRCKQESTFDEVVLWPDIRKKLILKDANTFWTVFFEYLHQTYGIRHFFIPNDFPAFIYQQLINNSLFSVAFDEKFFTTQRAIKNQFEMDEIRKACALTSATIQYAKAILKHCQICGGQLYWEESVLTSERLRALMESYCYTQGGKAEGTIVACGQEAANPHCIGQGPLTPSQFIVIDFFPCLQSSHYYGDMTRTVLLGTPNDAQKRMYNCVLECQRQLIKQVRPGVSTKALMTFATDFFKNSGYALRNTPKGCEGFIHSVGHGIGLDLHEYPSVGNRDIILESGMVITIEPGLYYKDIGGVRIEDDVWVTENGCEVLTHCDYELAL